MPLNLAETARQPANKSAGIHALPSILVALGLFMLFALSGRYEHDAPSATSYKQWDIGVGPAHWLSISRHGAGLQEATVWGPLQFELHASLLAPILLILLIVLGKIRHRVMTRHGLTLGAALDRQLKRPEFKWPRLPALVAQLPRHLLNAILIATATGLLFNLFMPAQVHYTIESLEPARAEQLVERLEPALNETFPSFSVRVVDHEHLPASVVLEGRQHLFSMNNQLSTMISETGLTAGSGHSVHLSSHPATLPVILTTGALVLLLGWRRSQGNMPKPNPSE